MLLERVEGANGHPATTQEIMEAEGMTRQQVSRAMQRLRAVGVVMPGGGGFRLHPPVVWSAYAPGKDAEHDHKMDDALAAQQATETAAV